MFLVSAFPWYVLKCHSAEVKVQERSLDFSTGFLSNLLAEQGLKPCPSPKSDVQPVTSWCFSPCVLQNDKVCWWMEKSTKFNPVQFHSF